MGKSSRTRPSPGLRPPSPASAGEGDHWKRESVDAGEQSHSALTGPLDGDSVDGGERSHSALTRPAATLSRERGRGDGRAMRTILGARTWVAGFLPRTRVRGSR